LKNYWCYRDNFKKLIKINIREAGILAQTPLDNKGIKPRNLVVDCFFVYEILVGNVEAGVGTRTPLYPMGIKPRDLRKSV
jgi:hypothetical protein